VPTTAAGLYGSCTPAAAGASDGCVDNLCFAAGTNPGFCGLYCDTSTGDTTCGVGGVCWTDNNAIRATSGGTIQIAGGQFNVTGDRGGGACVKACTDNPDCPIGFHCAEFSGKRGCIGGGLPRYTTPAPGSVAVGGVCRTDADCGSNKCGKSATATGFADGTCQRATAGLTCPANTFSEADGVTCTPLCSTSTDSSCPDSLACFGNLTPVRCVRGLCRDDDDCNAGNVCDHAQGLCVASRKVGAGNVGDPCTMDAQCGGTCIMQRMTAPLFVNGYCTTACALLPDLSDTCPSGSICSDSAIGAVGVCLDLCDTSPLMSRFGVCRAGYTCKPFANDTRYGFCDSL
jgi:hypothetical protein